MADIGFDKSFRTALRIDESFLRRLYAMLTEFAGKGSVEIAIETDGNLTVKSKDLEEILRSDLIQADTIQKISVHGARFTEDAWSRASFDIEKDASWRTCSVRISGPSADQVIALKSRLEGLIRSARLWYSLFRAHGPTGAVLITLVLCTIIYVLGWAVLILSKLVVFQSGISFVITFASDFITAAMVLTFLGKRAFPGVVFDIGLSGRRAQSAAAVRNIVFVVIGLGLIVSVVANLVYAAMRG